ncbi:helix-turn-helix transcriptional regulator [Vibrio sp. V39_P1S14PM300]|uniref:helix-turn-helix transcriptional regulator n=1 Tax=Vibrio sp. V39_P1S14PM300 TaxID=1938690 RepID=UPI001929BA01|nr:response regulator transcription factor [Vibrio sp. V39_P1S14PM300]
MTIGTLVILTEKSLQSSLIEQQLASITQLNIQTCSAEQLNRLSSSFMIDLVLLDYHYLVELTDSDSLPDFDLLGVHILVHNIPEGELNELFIRWRSLRGMLYQSASVEHLTESVTYIMNGGLWLPRRCLEQMVHFYRDPGVFNNFRYDQLTNRERQILDLLSHGKTNQEIANQLFLAESTVKTHVYKLYKKLDVHRRHDAIRLVKYTHASSGL